MTEQRNSKYFPIINQFHFHLENLKLLNEKLPKLYSSYNDAELEKLVKTHTTTKEEDAILLEFTKSIQNKNTFDEEKWEKVSSPTLKYFLGFIENMMHKRTIEAFVSNMSIIYLITIFEDFLKEILKTSFKTNIDILKSTKNITFEEIIDLKTYDAIIEKLTEKKAQDIIDEDIDEIGDILLKDYKFPIRNDAKWNSFIEVFYRRHVLVHNNGKPDDRYRLKTGNTTDLKLDPNEKYIEETISLFKEYSSKIGQFFESKYPSSYE